MTITEPWYDVQLTETVCIRQTQRGVGGLPYGGFNLGVHVGDDPAVVSRRRARLAKHLGMPVHYVRQVHGVAVQVVDRTPFEEVDADALITREPDQALAILTADCLPIVLAGDGVIGVAHGGWRGVLGGIIAETVRHMQSTICCAWLGPCIGRDAFEVGPEVREAFVRQEHHLASFFRPAVKPDHWWCDLRGIAHQQLASLGVESIIATTACTLNQSEQYYSYRRDGVTGRMATVVWRSE